jgi:hypothetical protein
MAEFLLKFNRKFCVLRFLIEEFKAYGTPQKTTFRTTQNKSFVWYETSSVTLREENTLKVF